MLAPFVLAALLAGPVLAVGAAGDEDCRRLSVAAWPPIARVGEEIRVTVRATNCGTGDLSWRTTSGDDGLGAAVSGYDVAQGAAGHLVSTWALAEWAIPAGERLIRHATWDGTFEGEGARWDARPGLHRLEVDGPFGRAATWVVLLPRAP